MSNAKEIRGQIKSTKSTQKITKAMEMVAASKMRRAQNNMQSGRPYAHNILAVVAHLASAHTERTHPFLVEREEVKNVGYIVIGTDRGLCGGLNINLFKTVLRHIRESEMAGHGIRSSVFGRKAISLKHNKTQNQIQNKNTEKKNNGCHPIGCRLALYYQEKKQKSIFFLLKRDENIAILALTFPGTRRA